MDTTLFLAQLWGPAILAVGVGILLSRSYYVKLYRDLEREKLAVLTFGLVALTMGIIHINVHNVWSTFPQMFISLLGWGLLVKGIAFVAFPKVVDQSGDWAVHAKLLPTLGIVLMIAGVYLSWIGYFS
jgi:hypothetical protein